MKITPRAQIITGVITTLFALVASVWAGTDMLDKRHVTRIEYETQGAQLMEMGYTALKKEIRELREANIHADQSGHTEWADALANDLKDAVDRLCRDWPQDRECNR